MIPVPWPNANPRFPLVEFRRVFRQVVRPVPEGAEMVTAFGDGRVTLRSNRRLDGYHEASDQSGMQGVRSGDFVVHGLDILRGAVGVSDSDGALSSVCIVCRATGAIEPRYFAWQIRAQAASGLTKVLARGIREGGADFRRWGTLGELPVLNPPPHVQRAIADLLDAETARLDELIAKKQRMGEILGKRSDSLIAQFLAGNRVGIEVLDRLQPDHTQLRPSSAPAGVVLRHGWRWSRLGSFFRNIDERSSSGNEVLLSVSKIHGVLPREEIADRPPRADSLVGYKKCRKGDFIINQMSAYDGLMGVAPTDGIVTYHYLVFRPSRAVDMRFVELLLTSETYRQDFSRRVRGLGDSTQSQVRTPHIRIGDMLQSLIPLPDLQAQSLIVSAIERARARDRSLQRHLVRQLELLREHRRALIVAAVTGDLDVPGATA